MINFNKWNDTTIQVGLEGAVFIFVHRLPFAVRASGDKETFINLAMCQLGTPAMDCLNKMRMMTWSLTELPLDKFRIKAKEIYANAILNGARRVGLECILPEENHESDIENHSGHVENRNAWNRRTRPAPI